MTAMAISTVLMTGTEAAYEILSSRCPRGFSSRSSVCISFLLMNESIVISAMNETELARKQKAMPTVAMRVPAIIGPIARATFASVELSVTALRRFSCPTISWTNVWRVGLSITSMSPKRTAETNSIHI